MMERERIERYQHALRDGSKTVPVPCWCPKELLGKSRIYGSFDKGSKGYYHKSGPIMNAMNAT